MGCQLKAKARLTQGVWHCTRVLGHPLRTTDRAWQCPARRCHDTASTEQLWQCQSPAAHPCRPPPAAASGRVSAPAHSPAPPAPCSQTREQTRSSDVPKTTPQDASRPYHRKLDWARLVSGNECAHPLVLCTHPLELLRRGALTCSPPQAVILALQITDTVLKL